MGYLRTIKNIANSIYSPLQSILKLYYRPKQYIKKFGKSKGLSLYHQFYSNTTPQEEVRFTLDGYDTTFYLRQDTSDVPTFQQIFLNTRYAMDLPFRPKTIIDGGANVGFASAFFANKYPESEVLAIEPEKSNFNLVNKNTQSFSNVKTLQSAIWGKTTSLRITNPNVGKWGFEVEETENHVKDSFQAFSIEDLINQMGWASVDLLKLDIEGSEMNVFKPGYETWLPNVKMLIIELHEKMHPGCTEVFENAISKYPFRKSVSGENLVYVNEGL